MGGAEFYVSNERRVSSGACVVPVDAAYSVHACARHAYLADPFGCELCGLLSSSVDSKCAKCRFDDLGRVAWPFTGHQQRRQATAERDAVKPDERNGVGHRMAEVSLVALWLPRERMNRCSRFQNGSANKRESALLRSGPQG